jgi:F-type H+-transporting ATPase subunit a
MANPFEHVQDNKHAWVISERLFGGIEIPLPHIPGTDLYVTKFMILELVAAVLIVAIFIPLCRSAAKGGLPRGPWWNAFESLLTFIRDDVAKPSLGEHDADRYVPFLWTLFLFILFMNLLGMIPFMGSPTASIWVTGGLAVCSFIMMHAAAIVKMGGFHYLQSLWPHIDIGEGLLSKTFGFVLSVLIMGIELMGTVIKSFVLAVRLFANMFAGHMVLAMILGFIVLAGNSIVLWPFVTFFSVVGVVALSLLELFVAFLQAYIFVFLTALFVGMSLHPSH